jgi:hypothetical protein
MTESLLTNGENDATNDALVKWPFLMHKQERIL